MKTETNRIFAMGLVTLFVVGAALTAITQGISHKRAPTVSLDAPTKRKLVEKALLLKAGDSYESVTNTLGHPTSEKTYTTRADAQTASFRQTGRFLEYHMQVWEGAYGEDAEFVKN